MKWAKEAGISEENFTASNGCISGVLKRNVKISINLHVQAGDLTGKAAAALMCTWLKGFHNQIDDLSVPRARIYNANQTGLFYTKLPNRIYIIKSERENYLWNKHMKSKD